MGYKEIDNRARQIVEQPKRVEVFTPYSAFDGMASFDSRRKNAIEKASVQTYIDKQNELEERLNNVEHTWHLQKKDKLSKTRFGRARVAMEILIKDFSS
jgi:hypothetical protein